MTIIIPIIAVTVIGLACAVMLSVASSVMEVKTDERITKIRECLPGANCGACGYTGCDGYAKALVEDDGVKTNLCVPGADAAAAAIAEVLGVEAEDVIEQVAVVCCRGDCEHTHEKYAYQGIESCAAAKLIYGGDGACVYGCLGHGDCASVCPKGAITVIDSLASIDTSKCIGCGLCVKTCPNNVIRLMADVEVVLVACNNTEMGAATRKECTNGCIGCRKCERGCPEKAISVVNNLARIDYDKCVSCGTCAENCPTGAVLFKSFLGAHKV